MVQISTLTFLRIREIYSNQDCHLSIQVTSKNHAHVIYIKQYGCSQTNSDSFHIHGVSQGKTDQKIMRNFDSLILGVNQQTCPCVATESNTYKNQTPYYRQTRNFLPCMSAGQEFVDHIRDMEGVTQYGNLYQNRTLYPSLKKHDKIIKLFNVRIVSHCPSNQEEVDKKMKLNFSSLI